MPTDRTDLELSDDQIQSISEIVEEAILGYLKSASNKNLRQYIVASLSNTKPAATKTNPIRSKSSFYKKAAGHLYDELKAKRRIMRKPSLLAWGAEIKKFLIDSGIDRKEFKDTLIWYGEHCTDQFVPRAYSAKSFCERYVQILDAKDRYEYEHKPSKSQQVEEQAQSQTKTRMKTPTNDNDLHRIIKKVVLEYTDVGCSTQAEYDEWVVEWEESSQEDWRPPALSRDEWRLYKKYRKQVQRGQVDEIKIV